MENKIEKFEKEVKELKKNLLIAIAEAGVDLNDDDDCKAIKMVFESMRLLDASIELVTEEYRTIDAINKKIDVLLEKAGA